MDSKLYLAENVLNERRPVCYLYCLEKRTCSPESGYLSLLEPSAQSACQSGQTVCSVFATPGIGIETDINIPVHSLLFEFHRNENAKKPQTVHATYVISGIQKAPEPSYTNGHGNDEDETMQSSPYLPSSMLNQDLAPDSSRPASIVLAREEDLEGTLKHGSQ